MTMEDNNNTRSVELADKEKKVIKFMEFIYIWLVYMRGKKGAQMNKTK